MEIFKCQVEFSQQLTMYLGEFKQSGYRSCYFKETQKIICRHIIHLKITHFDNITNLDQIYL